MVKLKQSFLLCGDPTAQITHCKYTVYFVKEQNKNVKSKQNDEDVHLSAVGKFSHFTILIKICHFSWSEYGLTLECATVRMPKPAFVAFRSRMSTAFGSSERKRRT